MWLEKMEKALASVVLDSSLMSRLHHARVSCMYSECVMCVRICIGSVCTALGCHSCTFTRSWIQSGWKLLCIKLSKLNLEFEGRTMKVIAE